MTIFASLSGKLSGFEISLLPQGLDLAFLAELQCLMKLRVSTAEKR
jgi:hypothetical protein